MVEGVGDRLIDELLQRLRATFRLDHRLAGGTLADLVVDAIRTASRLDEPSWGGPGSTAAFEEQTRGPLTFTYRPHLFPDMDDALRLGHTVQFSLLPRHLPEPSPVEIAAVLESYCHLSGDLIGWHGEPCGGLTAWLLDLSGHGVRAGFAAVVMKLLIAELDSGLPLDERVAELDRRFVAARSPEDPAALYATGVFLRLGPDGDGEYVSAGHVPMLVRRANGRIEEHGSTGVPIALVDGPRPQVRPFRLERGDLVVLASDGLLEARDSQGVPFGAERVARALAMGPEDPAGLARELYRAVERHHDLTRLDDDLTFVLARRRDHRGGS